MPFVQRYRGIRNCWGLWKARRLETFAPWAECLARNCLVDWCSQKLRRRSMTELKLVDWLQRQPGTKGIGDDCFIYSDLVFTTDMMVEGVHFEQSAEPEAIGHKTLARGLSDIA